MRSRLVACSLLIVCGLAAPAHAQLDDLPGHDRYEQVRALVRSDFGRLRRLDLRWSEDGRALSYRWDGEPRRFDLDLLEPIQVEEPAEPDADASDAPTRRRQGPARGRQRSRERSPDDAWVAVATDWNVLLERPDGSVQRAVTRDGHRKLRYGAASWVYGEELGQREAMWWSPDARRLAFYEFDEREVRDFFLLDGLEDLRTEVLTEGYPKPGEPNPIARLLVYDLQTDRTIPVDVGPDREQYVYAVRFSPDGEELLFNRTNRRQNVLELCAADPATGATRVVLREEQETWQHNRPEIRFLDDGLRFIWETERTGYKQYELRHLDGRRLATLTRGDYPAQRIVHVDEEADGGGVLYYAAFSDDDPLNAQLHSVGLDGGDQRRLTEESMHHQLVEVSPDGRWFVTRYESIDTPPTLALYRTDGRRVTTLAEPLPAKLAEAGVPTPERFTVATDDGTILHGILYRPTGFDPAEVYPLVIDVYGGPLSQRVRNSYRGANPACELGFLIAVIDNRGTRGRGKAFEAAAYRRLGSVDLDDQILGVQTLSERPYVDGDRVGIIGHSYGGYMAALAVLKHPDHIDVAVADAAVTDWRNYDSIYTERFMWTPQENTRGYDEGSCMTYAEQLRGRLLIMHGMVDDNVHPTNAWQLVDRLTAAGKDFDMRFYPSRGHGLGPSARPIQWRYLYDHLVEDVGASP